MRKLTGEPLEPGRAVGSALTWNLANQLLTQLVSLGVFLVLARQLSPAAFGAFALALLFVEAFATEARAALVDVLLMRREFSRSDLSAVLWWTTGGAFCIWALLAALSPMVGGVLQAPEVAEILPWLGVAVLIAPLHAVFEAQTLNRLAFRALAQRNMLASLVGAAGALAALFSGLGLWALVVQRLLISLTGVVFLMAMTRWTPVLALHAGDGQGVLKPFMKLWLSQMINFASGRGVDLIIGLKLGTGALGVYRVALRIVETVQSLATRPLLSALLPVLTRHPPASPGQQEHYRQIAGLASLMAVPTIAGLALVSPELAGVLLDDRYVFVGAVLAVLAAAGLVAPLYYFRGVALTAASRPGVAALLAAIELGSLAVLVWLGASFGVREAAIGIAASSVLLAFVSAATVARVMKMPLLGFLAACAPPYLGALAMAVAIPLARASLGGASDLLRLPILVGLGVVVFTAHMILFHRGWLRARIAYLTGARASEPGSSPSPPQAHQAR